MREISQIKFRALYEGKWYYQTLEEMLSVTLGAFRLGEHKTQWTGLKDKSGTPIYEGDIMEYNGNGIGKEVVFSNGSFGIINVGKHTEGKSFGSYNIDNGIVVGNIHQHPHLLNK